MGLRQQISWLTGGGARAQATLDEHAQAIRQLQQQVAELSLVVARIDAGSSDPEAWTSVRDGVRQAVEDVSGRIAALADRVDRLEA
jgi:hypothetical protein